MAIADYNTLVQRFGADEANRLSQQLGGQGQSVQGYGQAQQTQPVYQATGRADVPNVTTGKSWSDSLGIFASDKNAYDSEYARVTGLINSNTAPDMKLAQQWLGQLQQAGAHHNLPQQPQQTIPQINPNDYRTNVLTTKDIGDMFGFDYSKEYAMKQAEAEAQAKRNAYTQGLRANEAANKRNIAGIDQGVRSALDGLDTERFFAQQATNQNQSLTGANAGIAGDQNTRLAMSAQGIMGDIHGQANLGRMDEQQRFTQEALRMMEGLALTEQEKLAYADALYNERLQQGFGNAMQMNQFNQNENLAQLQAALQLRGQDINMNQFDRSFDWSKMMDEANLTGNYKGQQTVQEQQRQFSNTMAKDSQDWGKMLDQIGMTGRLPAELGGGFTVQEQQRRIQNDLAREQFERPYNELTKYQQAQIDSQAEAQKKDKDMSPTQMLGVLDMFMNAPPEIQEFLKTQYPMLGNLSGSSNLNPSEWDSLYLVLGAEDAGINFKKTNETEIKQYIARSKAANGWSDAQANQAEKDLLKAWNDAKNAAGSSKSWTEQFGEFFKDDSIKGMGYMDYLGDTFGSIGKKENWSNLLSGWNQILGGR